MFFEVSFGYLDRGMSHGIADEILLVAPEIGNGRPTVAGTVAAQPFHPAHTPCQSAKAIIEVAQRILVLAVFVIARTADKREKVGRNTVVHRAEINGTEHVHVGGDGIPLQPAVQQMVLKALQPDRKDCFDS